MPDRAAPSFQASSLGYQVNLLARLLAQLLQEAIAGYGVTPGQFPQLLALYAGDGQTPSELSRATQVELGTITKTLQRMERDGLVERRADPQDGRSVRIHLTPRAQALESDLKAAATAVNDLVTEDIGEARLRTFMSTLDALIARSQVVRNSATTGATTSAGAPWS